MFAGFGSMIVKIGSMIAGASSMVTGAGSMMVRDRSTIFESEIFREITEVKRARLCGA